jgi:hypothetical protein
MARDQNAARRGKLRTAVSEDSSHNAGANQQNHGATPQGGGQAPKMSAHQIARHIMRLAENDGDRCSLCLGDFPHASLTYGGVTRDGAAALTCEACAPRLAEVVGGSVYFASDMELARRAVKRAGRLN